MAEDCARQLAIRMVWEASAAMGNPGTSQERKKLSFSFALGARWAIDLSKTVSAHVSSRLVRRRLANPATKELSRKLREGLHETWSALGEQLVADSSSWRAFLEERGIMDAAPRQGRETVVSRLQEWQCNCDFCTYNRFYTPYNRFIL